MNDDLKGLQSWLNTHGAHLVVDGIYGPATELAGAEFFRSGHRDPKEVQVRSGHRGPNEVQVHSGYCSSFADPNDIRAFRKCKKQGMSDLQAFKYGDNGIGCFGDDTTVDLPMCALIREDWQHLDNPRGTRVLVEANGRSVECTLRDTLPARRHVKHGVVIDLNPAACDALGLAVPAMAHARWRFA
jgi:hypothetical protein